MHKKLIEFFVKNTKLTNWVLIVVSLAGIFALSQINRRINPKMELERVTINIPFPGASAVEVEEGVVIKVEEALRGMEGVEKIYSTSSDNFGSIEVEFSSGWDMTKAIKDVTNKVNSISSYPLAAEKPVIYQSTMWNRAIMLNIYGPTDLFTLKKVVDEFSDDLLRTGKITNIMTWGLPPREFSIEASPDNLIRYSLTIDDISRAIRNANLDISSGSVVTDQEEIVIRAYNKKFTAHELEKIEVVSKISGQKVLLKDICTVVEQFPENLFYSEYNDKKAVGFNVMYSNEEDVIEIVKITEETAEKYRQKYAGLVNFNTFIRETDELQERIDLLSANGIIGLVLVIITLGIFLNVRLSFWVALGVPFSLLGMLFVLWILGITINEMSLFGMIMVIGILVDDGIIIGESIYSEWEKGGKTRYQASIDGTMKVIAPVVASILTTMVAFVPYFYFYGMLGKHIWEVAAVIIIALAFSLIEAFIILPAHLAHSKALGNNEEKTGFFASVRKKLDSAIGHFINNIYGKVLSIALKNRYSVIAVLVASILVIAGLFKGSHVDAQFFPNLEPPYARIQLEVPAGTSAEIADKLRNRMIETSLQFGREWSEAVEGRLNPIEKYTSWMNAGTINIFFVLPSAADRDYTVGEFSDALSAYIGNVPEAENLIVGGWTFGGNPISVKFQSTDYSQLLKAKELLKSELKNISGVKDIQDDTPLGNNEFVVTLKEKGHALGFTLMELTSQLRQGFYGQEAMRLQRGRDEVKVWVRFDKENRVAISQIENLKMRTPTGEFVPFREVADFKIQRSVRRIRHENGERSVTVFANLDHSKNNLAVVLGDLNSTIVPKVLSQVEGVSRSYGGQSEEVGKMLDSMTYSTLIALIVMFTIIMFVLKSYAQSIMIIGLIPLGLIGAVIGHYIVGIPISILSFLGIVALAGIIVNDSIVLVDKFNKGRAEGQSLFDALYEAGKTRFRPIVLTTITTVAGLTPMILLKSEQGQFLVPMAVSIAFGLIYGSFLTLMVLPSGLYVHYEMLDKIKSVANSVKLWFNGKPAIEDKAEGS
ncbi:MAG: efflux RND transporter permease subunit [Ignavibacteriaceae bacterium]|nr:efflux RND transporter permease subunit [Ignavibacteriaceae bacterium]